MRKLRAWGMLFAMCMFVFALSGCGGGSLDSNSDTTSDTIPNNTADTYDTANVLAGEWSVLNDTVDTISLRYNDTNIQMRMISARMNLADVYLEDNGGILSIKNSKQEWYVLVTTTDYQTRSVPYIDEDGNLRYQIEIEEVSSVLMTHAGKNKWRFEFIKDNGELNRQATSMNIEITSESTIHVKQQDIVHVASYDVFYETEFDMRKVSSY